MRKTLTLFLFLIVLMQVMGYYVVFRLRQSELKTEVRMYLKAHVEDRHLTHLEFILSKGRILNKQFEWKEENEFEFAGEMYDVINKSIHGNRMVITCLQDEKETELLKSFEQSQQRQSQNGKSRTASLLQFFGNVFVIAEAESIPALPGPALTCFIDYNPHLIDRSGEILTPPPQHC